MRSFLIIVDGRVRQAIQLDHPFLLQEVGIFPHQEGGIGVTVEGQCLDEDSEQAGKPYPAMTIRLPDLVFTRALSATVKVVDDDAYEVECAKLDESEDDSNRN